MFLSYFLGIQMFLSYFLEIQCFQGKISYFFSFFFFFPIFFVKYLVSPVNRWQAGPVLSVRAQFAGSLCYNVPLQLTTSNSPSRLPRMARLSSHSTEGTE